MAVVTKFFKNSKQVTPILENETSWNNLTRFLGNTSGTANAAVSNSVASKSGTAREVARFYIDDVSAGMHKNAKINNVKFTSYIYTRDPAGGSGTGSPQIADIGVSYRIGSTNYSGSKITSSATKTRKQFTKTWTGATLTPNNINRDDFGVYVNPGANTTGNRGSLRFDTIRLLIDYTNPTYSISGTKSQPTSNLGNEEHVTFVVKNTNNVDQKQSLDNIINIPSGIEIVSVTGTNPPSLKTGNNNWNPVLSNGQATLKIVFKSTTISNKLFKCTQSFTGVSNTQDINIVNESYQVRTTPVGDIYQTTGSKFDYKIEVISNMDTVGKQTFRLPLNNLVKATAIKSDGDYDPLTGIWNASFQNRKSTILMTLNATTVGVATQSLFFNDIDILNQQFTVDRPSQSGLYNCKFQIPQKIQNLMKEGRTYNIRANFIVNDNDEGGYIYNGELNYKIGVVVNNNIEYGGTRPQNVNTQTMIYTEFLYENTSDIINVVFYGEYLDSLAGQVPEFCGLELYEGEYNPDNEYQTPIINFMATDDEGEYIPAPENLIDPQAEVPVAIIPSNYTTATHFFDDLPILGLLDEDNLVIRGFKINMESGLNNTLVVETRFKSGDNYGNKYSRIFSEDTTEIEIGGEFDLFGLRNPQINLEDLGFELIFRNNTLQELECYIGNITFSMYYETSDFSGCLSFSLSGEENIFRSLRLTDGELPNGTNVDISTMELKGNDGELVLSSDIRSKTFKFVGEVLGDNLKETQRKIKDITQYLTGNRDTQLLPNTQEMVLSFNPDIAYDVMLSSPINVEYTHVGADISFEFMIPEGLGHTKDPIVFASSGTNDGILSVYPTITVLCLGDVPKIIDSISGQSMDFSSGFENGEILTIDCKNRKVYNSYNMDISDQVTILSDYFVVRREFDFSGSRNCIIQSVSFNQSE